MAKGETYEEFTEKFVPKRTSDDCYTPAEVYEEVKAWAVENLHLEGREIVRPFWPGGDYKSFAYPENCVVIDNPPFSIYAEIVRFYISRGIDFLLFAPSLTQLVFDADVCYICTHNEITYTNGAVVRTGFTTNLMPGIRICSVPELREKVQKVADEFKRQTAKELGKNKKEVRKIKKYAWPDHCISSAQMGKIVVRGVPLNIPASECKYIRKAGGGRYIRSRAASYRAGSGRAGSGRAGSGRAGSGRGSNTY